MRTVRRLRLRFVCLRSGHPNPNGFYIAGLSISLLLTQSILCQARHKHTSWMNPLVALRLEYVYGGPGGHCPRVLNPFQSTSYSLTTVLVWN